MRTSRFITVLIISCNTVELQKDLRSALMTEGLAHARAVQMWKVRLSSIATTQYTWPRLACVVEHTLRLGVYCESRLRISSVKGALKSWKRSSKREHGVYQPPSVRQDSGFPSQDSPVSSVSIF